MDNYKFLVMFLLFEFNILMLRNSTNVTVTNFMQFSEHRKGSGIIFLSASYLTQKHYLSDSGLVRSIRQHSVSDLFPQSPHHGEKAGRFPGARDLA